MGYFNFSYGSSFSRRAMEKTLDAEIDPDSELLTAIDFDKELYDLETYEIKTRLL